MVSNIKTYSSDDISRDILIINHHKKAGFFSICSEILIQIIKYINTYNKTPDSIDTSQLFFLYKDNTNKNIDIFSYFFNIDNDINLNTNNNINISSVNNEIQFTNYKLINFNQIKPVINKYFLPNREIKNRITFLENKYNLNYNNLLTVYYRSTDKSIETNIPSIETIINKIKEVKIAYPDLNILYMTDDLQTIKNIYDNFTNVIIIEELLKHHNRGFEHAKWFLTSVIVMSKAHSIITTSGNVSNWILYYRNNSNNIYQYLSPKEYIYGVKNKFYEPTQTNFWL